MPDPGRPRMAITCRGLFIVFVGQEPYNHGPEDDYEWDSENPLSPPRGWINQTTYHRDDGSGYTPSYC